MARFIVLDVETTGIGPGHKVVELCAVEFDKVGECGKTFHTLLNPERDVSKEAFEVHGHSLESLQSQPKFSEVAETFVEFVKGAHLVIHNAPFDSGMLSDELGYPLETLCESITDTLAMARSCVFTGKHTLDALCDYFKVDRTARELHGALIDCVLLAKVYPKLVERYSKVQEAFKVLGTEGLSDPVELKSFSTVAKEYLTLGGIIGYFEGQKDLRNSVLSAAYKNGLHTQGGYTVSFSDSSRVDWKTVQEKLLKGVDLSPYKVTSTRISVKMESAENPGAKQSKPKTQSSSSKDAVPA
jgi:DNA polymerase-3 subunit epsilon